jgi:uncharacterized membrane protein
MSDPNLFAHIDTAIIAIAVLALVVAPFLIPLPPRFTRAVTAFRARTRPRAAQASDPRIAPASPDAVS